MELGNDGMRHAIQSDWEGVTGYIRLLTLYRILVL